jgi:hypothetical protein
MLVPEDRYRNGQRVAVLLVRACHAAAGRMNPRKSTAKASEKRAQRSARFLRQREREEQQRRDEVIAHFGGDRHAMAEEILRYRRAVMQLAATIDRSRCRRSGSRSRRDVNG